MNFQLDRKIWILISFFLFFLGCGLNVINHPPQVIEFSPDWVFGKSSPCPDSPTKEEVLSCVNESCSVLPLPNLKTDKKRLPGAILIGVKKGGTTTLITMLSMHSRISASSGEPHFFDKDQNYREGWKWYLKKLRAPSSQNQIIMEKSPRYFVCPAAPLRIKSMSPNIPLLLIVRDPVIRLISDFTMEVFRTEGGYKGLSFDETFINSNGNVNHNHMVDIGIYFKHLEQWLKYFPMNQIHLLDGDQMIKAPWIELEKAQRFLGLEVEITKENFWFNEEKGFFCMKGAGQKIQDKNGCMSKGQGHVQVNVSSKTISKLRGFYKPYNHRFYEMVDKNFGWPEA